MTRLLVLALLALALWLLLEWLYRKGLAALGIDRGAGTPVDRGSGRERTAPGSRRAAGPEPLVRCTVCGTYVPSSRALRPPAALRRRPAGDRPTVTCSEDCLRSFRTGTAP